MTNTSAPMEDAEVASIVARLQGVTLFTSYDENLALNNEAADLITRLAREIAAMKAAKETHDQHTNANADDGGAVKAHPRQLPEIGRGGA